jgi:hypothetical protein
MIFSMTRVAAAVLALAGLMAGGGSVATAASSAGRCQPGHHEACLTVGGATALPPSYRLLIGDASHLLAIANRRSARPRIVVHPRSPYPPEEHGAIYGYAPGSYLLGQAGVLYGPYPLNPDAPIAELRY